MYVPVQDEEADGEAQRELLQVGIEEASMKSDELIEDYCFDATDNQTKAVYPKADVDAAIDELKDELNRAKVREDVLVTDNRNLLDKVKMLEERLRENADHFKRNEAHILENADKEIRHNKSKRCLNNAWWCRKLSNTYTLSAYTHRGWKIARYYDEKAELYRKWHKRWLSIAEKFKEAAK